MPQTIPLIRLLFWTTIVFVGIAQARIHLLGGCLEPISPSYYVPPPSTEVRRNYIGSSTSGSNIVSGVSVDDGIVKFFTKIMYFLEFLNLAYSVKILVFFTTKLSFFFQFYEYFSLNLSFRIFKFIIFQENCAFMFYHFNEKFESYFCTKPMQILNICLLIADSSCGSWWHAHRQMLSDRLPPMDGRMPLVLRFDIRLGACFTICFIIFFYFFYHFILFFLSFLQFLSFYSIFFIIFQF